MAENAMAMMNVRLEREVKDAGDHFLADMGVSVTELVRALWNKLAKGDRMEARRQVEAIMAPEAVSDRQAEIDRKMELVHAASQMPLRFAGQYGLDMSSYVPPADNKDAIAEARYEYLQEKWGEV